MSKTRKNKTNQTRIWYKWLEEFMAKKEPQITVTTVFDGGLQAKGIFADLIIEKKKCRSLKESTSV